jgi:hypothetical protein
MRLSGNSGRSEGKLFLDRFLKKPFVMILSNHEPLALRQAQAKWIIVYTRQNKND